MRCILVLFLDRTIKVCNVSEGAYEVSATLQGHEGPVWQVSWAHPKFGVILASCSFDGSVLIHRESRPREWTIIHAARQLHESSVNGVAFAPHEFGLMLAAASSDGRVSVLQHDSSNQTWIVDYLQDCPMGVNAVSWAPAGAYYQPASSSASGEGESPAAASEPELPHLVTAGCDNTLRFWQRASAAGEWIQQDVPQCAADSKYSHSDWVRDVAWAPSMVPNHNRVASCSEDGQVLIWTQDSPTQPWKAQLVKQFDTPVWRVSWSATGHVLAVSSGDSTVTLWKEGLSDGTWIPMQTTDGEPTQSDESVKALPPPPAPSN